jgi:hypothetical protein
MIKKNKEDIDLCIFFHLTFIHRYFFERQFLSKKKKNKVFFHMFRYIDMFEKKNSQIHSKLVHDHVMSEKVSVNACISMMNL